MNVVERKELQEKQKKGHGKMKTKKQRNIHSRFWISLSLILCMLVTSFPSYAMVPIEGDFVGLEDVEVEEGTQFDLLEHVSAYGLDHENLEIAVTAVTCQTDDTFVYDNSNILTVGTAGSEYTVEYSATSPTNENIAYAGSRKIVSVKAENDITSEENVIEQNKESKGVPIIYDGQFHYIEDPEYPGERIILYCMNNKLNWPHHTPDMGETQIPDYINGYLGPEDFESEQDYRECMRRFSKLLYAGYPYNGERLYQIVENAENYKPTEEQFNKMLITPPILQTAFPVLGHHEFQLSDWEKQDSDSSSKTHMEELQIFVNQVVKLNPDGITSNGLNYEDIVAMPFYKAAFCMLYDKKSSPLDIFSNLYGTSYFVTESQAYDATQAAVWKLLSDYKIPDNDLTSISHSPLGEVLYLYSERGGLLEYQPNVNDIKLKGDLKFTYNPKDGMWHSGKLMLIEPEEYHGLYRLKLPEGWSAKCEHLTYVYGNEEYELVSDHQPQDGETFGIEADFVWLKDVRQYTPASDVEVNGKKFQHMIGAVIRKEKITADVPVHHNDVGSLQITKTVKNDDGNQEEFEFVLKLPYHKINGLYGDLEFHDGVSEFTLKNGETKNAVNLPATAEYKITEKDSGEYEVISKNDHGTIVADQIKNIEFTNVKLHDLTISKTVAGAMGNKKKVFTFGIQLKNKNNQVVEGIYDYVGSVKSGFEQEAVKPEDGKVEFKNGYAEIQLLHGQQITIQNLPPDTNYTVIEKEANQDGYTTTYNGDTKEARGIVNQDAEVHVVNTKEHVPVTGILDHTQGIAAGIAVAAVGLAFLLVCPFLRSRKGQRR